MDLAGSFHAADLSGCHAIMVYIYGRHFKTYPGIIPYIF
jgi:hypothetical protein